jgi:peroxiredoxin Q/BCP
MAKEIKTTKKSKIESSGKTAAAKLTKSKTIKTENGSTNSNAARAAKALKAAKVGEAVADFSLPSTSGQDFSLKDFKGKKVVLYFYPKDSTPGCTTEGLEFSKLIKEFRKNKTEVFGVSRDSLKSHGNFKGKQDFQFELLSDAEESACGLFDVIHEKNMYGRKVLGVVRSTFLIGEDGKLLKEWRKVKAEGHAEEVLNYIKGL